MVRAGGLILADNTLRPEMLDPAGDGGAKRYNAPSLHTRRSRRLSCRFCGGRDLTG